MTAVASTGTAVLTLPTETQILITREFDAPKDLVFRAYTTPELVKRWWAGKRGKVTSADVDLRVGGTWRWVMDADAGFEVAFNGTYIEIVPNERLVYTEAFEGAPGYQPGDEGITNTVIFSEQDGRTTLTMLSECHTTELRDIILESGMEGGMQGSMDALEEVAISLR